MPEHRLDPDRIADEATRLFVEDSFNCAEGVVAAFSLARGEPARSLSPLVAPFGGGVGSLGHMCGAISGALVVIGRHAAERNLPRPEVRAMAQELYGSFERAFGTTACGELKKHDCERDGGAPFDLRRCGRYLRHAVESTCASLEPGSPARERARGEAPPPAAHG